MGSDAIADAQHDDVFEHVLSRTVALSIIAAPGGAQRGMSIEGQKWVLPIGYAESCELRHKRSMDVARFPRRLRPASPS